MRDSLVLCVRVSPIMGDGNTHHSSPSPSGKPLGSLWCSSSPEGSLLDSIVKAMPFDFTSPLTGLPSALTPSGATRLRGIP